MKHSRHTELFILLNAPGLEHSFPTRHLADSSSSDRSQLSHYFLQEAFPDLPTLVLGSLLLELPISSSTRAPCISGYSCLSSPLPTPRPGPDPG